MTGKGLTQSKRTGIREKVRRGILENWNWEGKRKGSKEKSVDLRISELFNNVQNRT